MQIVFAASECAPWARTGGLGEVVGALSRQIAGLGHNATVYLPYYRQVRERLVRDEAPELEVAIPSLTIPFGYYNRFASILNGGVHDGVQIYFVDCPEMFDRESLYAVPSGEYADNWERFGLFCRAVLEATKQLGVPDVFHVHDWQAGLIPVYLKTVYANDPALRNRATVLTIHNAGYQGLYPPQTTEKLLFPWEIFTMDRVEHYDKFNFLKGGIVYSDLLTTVSPRYAQEIQTTEFGEGLEGALRKRAADLMGILNGVDYAQWNPAADGNIAAHYSPENLAGKAECRRDLLHAFGAGTVNESTAVLGMVTRLATQKGIDLVEQISGELLHENVVLVALGTGEAYYENLFRSLAAHYSGRVMVKIAYDDMLAHKVEAGSDMFLMPSHYEPCGLNQFYSLKYGTVPVVRGTGGLEDTVEEWDPATRKGTGFKFHGYKPEDFLAAIRRGLTAFEEKDSWHHLMRNGMAQDYSWGRSAAEYVEVYERVARARS
jgi:starch synthase